jgi:hypothetical protein
LEFSVERGETAGKPIRPPPQAATTNGVAHTFREAVAEGDEPGPAHRLGIVSQLGN